MHPQTMPMFKDFLLHLNSSTFKAFQERVGTPNNNNDDDDDNDKLTHNSPLLTMLILSKPD